MTDDVGALIEEIQRYAGKRVHDVTRGAETPALAALMVEKFGEGLVQVPRLCYREGRARRPGITVGC